MLQISRHKLRTHLTSFFKALVDNACFAIFSIEIFHPTLIKGSTSPSELLNNHTAAFREIWARGTIDVKGDLHLDKVGVFTHLQHEDLDLCLFFTYRITLAHKPTLGPM